MRLPLPSGGAAGDEFAGMVHNVWVDAAEDAGIDLARFDPTAPLVERIAWASGIGLDVAAVYAWSSCRHPQSVANQVRKCMAAAPSSRTFVPTELVEPSNASAVTANTYCEKTGTRWRLAHWRSNARQ